MPSIKEHVKLSLKRSGKGYREVHEWMDRKRISCKERIARHNIANIPKFLPFVEKQFGKDGINEYLQHIKDDYEKNVVMKIFMTAKKFRFW